VSIFKSTPPPAPAPEPIDVVLEAANDIDEIYLIDARFKLVARGFGKLVTTIPPGVYKLKVRAGEQVVEEYIVLHAGDSPVRKQLAEVRFATAAPLTYTTKSHPHHIEAACAASTEEHVSLGNGSWIFVMTRQWSPPNTSAVSQPHPTDHHPAAGLHLTLANGRGEPPSVGNVDLATASVTDFASDAWAACNIQVNPGLYLLSLDLPSGRRIQQTIVATPGWQTQVFLLPRLFPHENASAPDLLNAAILMHRGKGFDPDRREDRLCEIARHSLMSQRAVVRDEIERMLQSKLENPMLGLFGAHLLLSPSHTPAGTAEKTHELVRHVVDSLRDLMMIQHPDVEALALSLSGETRNQYRFDAPPMLRQSWGQVIDATNQNPMLVPEGSLSERVSEQLWGPSSWMVWERQSSTDEQSVIPWLETNVGCAIDTALKATLRKFSRSGGITPDATLAALKPVDEAASLSSSAATPHPTAPASVDRANSIPPEWQEYPETLRQILTDDDELKRLAHVSGLPRGKVDRYIAQLQNQFLTTGTAYNTNTSRQD
jgi:hypothetical protein